MEIRLGKVAGAPIIITGNLLIYAGIYVLFALMRSSVQSALMTLLAITAVASCVLLHEIGHVLAGKKYGVRAIDITLNFFGGMASNHPGDWRWLMDQPKKAMFIWICGPLVNIGLASILTLAMIPLAQYHFVYSSLEWVRNFNIVMAVFNLLPLYPMDGGGILYSVLRMFTTKLRAIKVASYVSMAGAAGLFLLALYFTLHGSNAVVACIIAAFIFYEAYQAPKSSLFR